MGYFDDRKNMEEYVKMTKAMALNVAAWTESSVRCLDVQTFRTSCLWWRQTGGSPIYLGAAIFDAEVADEELHSDLRMVQEAWGGRTIHRLGLLGNTRPGQDRFPARLEINLVSTATFFASQGL